MNCNCKRPIPKDLEIEAICRNCENEIPIGYYTISSEYGFVVETDRWEYWEQDWDEKPVIMKMRQEE